LENNILERENEQLPAEFEQAAAPAPPPERVRVTLEIDADLLAWLKAQPTDWQREINNTVRFFMETSTAPVPPPHDDDPQADFIPF